MFKEQQELVEKNNIDIYIATIACDTKNALENQDIEYTDEQFEIMCHFISNYVDNDANCQDSFSVACGIVEMILDDEYTLDDLAHPSNKLYDVLYDYI